MWRDPQTGQVFVRDTSKYGTLVDGTLIEGEAGGRNAVGVPLHAGAELALLTRSPGEQRDYRSWSRHTFPADAGFLFVLEPPADAPVATADVGVP